MLGKMYDGNNDTAASYAITAPQSESYAVSLDVIKVFVCLTLIARMLYHDAFGIS